MGPSGSGKSTLMHILAGLDRPTAGDVWIDGDEITRSATTQLTKLRRRHIGFVFQFFNLLPMLTAEENIAPAARDRRRASPTSAWVDELIATRRPRASGAAPPDRALRRPAAARRHRPRARLAADGRVRRRADRQPRLAAPRGEILELLRGAVESYGQTTVMVTHDASAAAIADRIVFLADGRIVQDAGPLDRAEVLDAMAEVSRR